MEFRNVTISLPADLLREVRHLAVDEGVSLSRFLALLLEQHVAQSQRYREARDRELQRLKSGVDLGTKGAIDWSRDELHER